MHTKNSKHGALKVFKEEGKLSLLIEILIVTLITKYFQE